MWCPLVSFWFPFQNTHLMYSVAAKKPLLVHQHLLASLHLCRNHSIACVGKWGWLSWATEDTLIPEDRSKFEIGNIDCQQFESTPPRLTCLQHLPTFFLKTVSDWGMLSVVRRRRATIGLLVTGNSLIGWHRHPEEPWCNSLKSKLVARHLVSAESRSWKRLFVWAVQCVKMTCKWQPPLLALYWFSVLGNKGHRWITEAFFSNGLMLWWLLDSGVIISCSVLSRACASWNSVIYRSLDPLFILQWWQSYSCLCMCVCN